MKYGSEPNVIEAISFAAHAHRNQRRKDAHATPYINHPISLLRILAVEASVEHPNVLCAAALHDFLEDCCGGPEQPSLEDGRISIRSLFGDVVLTYVEALSDDKSLPKEERKRLQITHANDVPHGARLVKLADKIANLRDIGESPPADWSLERRRGYFDWAKEVVDQIRGTHERLEMLFDLEFSRRP